MIYYLLSFIFYLLSIIYYLLSIIYYLLSIIYILTLSPTLYTHTGAPLDGPLRRPVPRQVGVPHTHIIDTIVHHILHIHTNILHTPIQSYNHTPNDRDMPEQPPPTTLFDIISEVREEWLCDTYLNPPSLYDTHLLNPTHLCD
jgi:hypothetical protein